MNDSNNKTLKILLGVVIALTVLSVGIATFVVINSKSSKNVKEKDKTKKSKTEQTSDGESGDSDSTDETEKEDITASLNLSGRPSVLGEKVTLYNPDVTANCASYTVNPDFSNVYNKDLYWFSDEEMKQLAENYFMVSQWGTDEFFEVYEFNRYDYQSNFITVDSLMHTYHLYFAHLMKNIERDELSASLATMTSALLTESNSQYDSLKSTEWEEAAKRNVAFFAIAAELQGISAQTSADVSSIVSSEKSKIMSASGIDICAITDDYEDYSQYKPRGYYDEDDTLKTYFRTMMWYGRIQFNTKSDEMVKSSMLMTLALSNSGLNEWKDIYDISSFFAGSSDDLGYYEYYPLLQAIYGDSVSVADITDNEKSFEKFKEEAAKLRLPEINSIPIEDGEENVIPGFRLMGQRFTIDAAIMQQLIYQNVDANPDGACRMLPDVLDVAAAFGSDMAYELLEEQGDTAYAGYTDQMERVKAEIAKPSAEMALRSNLAGIWLDTLRPLLTEKGEGYPMFMQSDEWTKKDLECFAGSYTELKHDTVLYAKQVIAEMGGGDIPEYDDRGYVQPEPFVYAKFAYLAEATRAGLEERGRISATDSENLKKLEDMAKAFITISEKELRDEVLTNEEYDFIREYGGNIEHFWYDVMSADHPDAEYISAQEYMAALCVDIATDPNGNVLELGLDNPSIIYVIVNVDGKIKIARGAVYSFYQFEWPLSDRLTDTKWRELMHLTPGADGMYNWDEEIPFECAWWTQSYKWKKER